MTRRLHDFYELLRARVGPPRGEGARWVLVLLLALIYTLGLWGIWSAHREAEALTLRDLRLQTEVQARAIENSLASSRSDLQYLSQSPPFASIQPSVRLGDPVARRWSRLDAEASALLFLAANPEVERILVWDGEDRQYLVAGRREGAPILFPPRSQPPLRRDAPLVRGFWSIGGGEGAGRLEAIVDLARVLRDLSPEAASLWTLSSSPAKPSEAPTHAAAELRLEGWTPEKGWRLESRLDRSPLPGATLSLARRQRALLLLTVGLLTLVFPLAWIAWRQLSRNAALEAENAHRARIQSLERQMWHSERLAGVGRLAAGMAHEINNPLEGAMNYLGVLARELQLRGERELLKVTGLLREGLDRIANTVGQVLTFADPGRTPMERVDLAASLRKSFDFVRANPSFRDVAMRLETPDLEVPVRGNPPMLGQLFLNLLLNACQVQPNGGRVEVACRREADHAVVTVADRGPGLPTDHASRIFEPFFSDRGSTGLGLSVVLGIVDLHGGSITAKNREDGGAVMSVRLPTAAGDQPAEGPDKRKSE